MKTHLVMVGHTNSSWLNEGINEYFHRITKYIPFETIVIPDIKKSKNLPVKTLKDKEGELILKNINNNSFVVLLDEKGKHYTSLEFSGFIEKQMISGIKNLYFIIGGAYGFSQEMYQNANLKISLSSMTFSHQMVRLLFTEQLYRGLTIINNEPYHHE